MGWVKGQSGNPNGRPRKKRALTEILEQAGSRTIEFEGKRIAGKRFLAQAVWEGITMGTVRLGGRRVLELSSDEWLGLVKWLYGQIDPATARHELTGADGGPMRYVVMWDDREDDGVGAPAAAPGAAGATR